MPSMQVVYSRTRKKLSEEDEDYHKFVESMFALNPFKSYYKREFEREAREKGKTMSALTKEDLSKLRRLAGVRW